MSFVDPPKGPPDYLTLQIARTENGFVVNCVYPKEMLADPVVQAAQGLMSTINKGTQKIEAGADPMNFVSEILGSLGRTPRPLRKPREEYVFTNTENMLKFVKETFDSSSPEAKAE